jgi:hypothetical protein
VRTISTFPGDLDDEHFIFSWKIDTTIKSGRYFAEMTSSEDDGDIIQSHIFEIVNSEEEKSYNEMDPMMDGISIADSMSDQMGMMDPMSMGDPMAGMEDPMAGMGGMADPMAGMGGMTGYGDPMAGMADPMAGMADPMADMTDPMAGMADPMAGMGGMADPMAGMANSFAEPMDTVEPMSDSMDTVELASGVSPIGQVDQSNSLDNSFQYDSGP